MSRPAGNDERRLKTPGQSRRRSINAFSRVFVGRLMLDARM
jgi:hypothetical protein